MPTKITINKKAIKTERAGTPVKINGPKVTRRTVKAVRTEEEQTPVDSDEYEKVSGSGMVPIDKLKLWKDNPWKHKRVIPKLAEALAIHGQVSPVVADLHSKVIYKGNHTYQAINYLSKHMRAVSNKIGIKVEDIRSKIDTTMIKVEFIDFPSEQAAVAYGISDNNLSKGGKYDPDTLLQIFKSDEEFYFKKPKHMAFSERDLKIYRDHRGNSAPRPKHYDEDDEEMVTGDYMLLTFHVPEVGERLKDLLSLDESTRKVNFERLYPYLNKKTQKFFDDIIDLPF